MFGNFILADEINRAPAKVQSALLEAMQERQVTLGDQTFKLTEPFLVLATQNPIEQEGTYPLPEAQLDRFMLKVKVGYPTRDEEARSSIAWRRRASRRASKVMEHRRDPRGARRSSTQVFVDDKVKRYTVDLVLRTRDPRRRAAELAPLIALRRLAARVDRARQGREGAGAACAAAATSRRTT